MSTLRLRNLAILSIEQELIDTINFDITIEEFSNKKSRKVTVYKIVVFISETNFLHFFTILPYMSLLLFA